MIKLPGGYNIPKPVKIVAAPVAVVTIANVKGRYIPPSRPIKTTRVRVLSGEYTDREKQIVALLIMAARPVDIASQLGISVKTVKFHKTNIYKKASVSNIAQLLYKELSRA